MHNIVLKIVEPTDENPFRQFPQLKNIWLPELATLAEEAIDEAFDYLKHYPDGDIGEIFLIYAEDANGKKLMGITGYLPTPGEPSEFMLRWHGFFKEYQSFGYSKEIIQFVANYVKETYSEAEKLIEFMPVIEAYIPIKSYFEKLGFKQVGNPEEVEWSEYKWQSYALDLKAPTNKIKNNL